jgi:hypothetical protein
MVIIKFVIRGAKVTWFVNDNWIMVICFLLTMTTGVIFRKVKNFNKRIKIPNPVGGTFIDECIEPDSAYELVDRSLEIVLKQMLNLPPQAGPIIISVPLLTLAYIVSRQPIKQITILGVSFFADKFKSLVLKAGAGILSGSVFFFVSVGVVSLTSLLLTGAIIFSIIQGINDFDCNDLVSKVSMERVSDGRNIGFLEQSPEKSPKVYIKGNENTELFSPSYNDNGSCSLEFKQIDLRKLDMKRVTTQPQTRIHRECRKEYTPLKQRTKTLSDLKREDSTENREKAAPYINRYEEYRKRIINKK